MVTHSIRWLYVGAATLALLLAYAAALGRGQDDFGGTGVTLKKRSNAEPAKAPTAPARHPRRPRTSATDVRQPRPAAEVAKRQDPTALAEEALQKGNDSFAKKEYTQAEASLQQAVSLNPKLVAAYNLLGDTYAEQDKKKEAIAAYTKAVALKRDDPDTYDDLGTLYLDTGKFADAVTAFGEEIKLKPNDVDANNKLAEAYIRLKRWGEAIETYKKLAELKPDAEIYFKIGQAYEQLQNLPRAVAAYQQATTLNADYADAYEALGFAHYRMQQTAQVVEDFENLTRLKSTGDAYYYLGGAYFDLERYGDAVTAYRKALDNKPGDVETLINLGKSYINTRQNPAAIEAFNQAIKLRPDSSDALISLGMAHLNKGQYDEAVAALQQANKLEPNNVDATFLMCKALNDQARQERSDSKASAPAVNTCQDLVRLAPNSARAYYQLGLAYKVTAQYTEAVNVFNKAISLNLERKDENSRAHYILGEAYMLLGNRDAAQAQYDILKTLDAGLASQYLTQVLK